MPTILHAEWSEGWGGQEIRIIQESLEFMKRGYRMVIACQPESRLYKVAKNKGIPVISFRMRAAIDPLAIMKFIHAIKWNSIDLVHTHSSVDSWCCSISAKLLGIPVIRSRHVSTPIGNNYLSFLLYMRLADWIITSGESIRQEMIKGNGFDPLKIVSIPAGIDRRRFSPEINGDYVRKDLNIRKEDFLVGTVAMLRSWKGHGYLLEAAKALGQKIPNIKLLITGGGPQESKLRSYIQNNALNGKVIMTGYREDVPQILRSLDIFVLPSYSNEGIPQCILQAMAMGIPVISTSVGGIGEVVKNGETGTLVPPRDTRALSEAIYRGYENKEESLNLARRAREVILKDFTLERTIEKTKKVYGELLERGRCEKIAIPDRGWISSLSSSSNQKKNIEAMMILKD